MDVASILLIVLGLGTVLGLGLFGLMAIRERERVAAGRAFGLAVVGVLVFFACTLLPSPLQSQRLNPLNSR